MPPSPQSARIPETGIQAEQSDVLIENVLACLKHSPETGSAPPE